MNKSDKIEIIISYIIFLVAGLFHVLHLFTKQIDVLFSPLFVIIFIWIIIKEMMHTDEAKGYSIYFFIGYFLSFLISLILFRNSQFDYNFHFGTVLKPQLFSVPLIAGFIWVSAIFTSTALIQRLSIFERQNIFVKSIMIGVTFLVFDIYLEPAAGRLGFWSWGGTSIPVVNYFVWLIYGSVMSYIGLKMKILNEKLSPVAMNLYIAQIIYFLVVFIS